MFPWLQTMADVDGAADGHQQVDAKEESEVCEELSLLRELCTVNGVNYEKLLLGAGAKVKSLEIFFFGCPKIVGLKNFPNLRKVQVINQKISSMSGIESCTTLEELWICEGEIQEIKGLELLLNLTGLYLYSNKISSITGLNHLQKLKKLWLNGNKISVVEGVSNLVNLVDLNLADNLITSVGDSLTPMKELDCLNLSGNPISSLQELFNIYQLSSLKHLSLCDPMYLPCPVCRLCNYSSIVLFHMPWLSTLDGREVESKDLHDLISNLVSKKKQFYRLKIHNQKQKLQEERKAIARRMEEQRRTVYSRLRALHVYLKSLDDSNSGIKDDAFLRKTTLINKRIKSLEETLSRDIANCKRDLDASKEKVKQIEAKWTRELASGGNTHYIDGREDLGWYESCVDLVNSRFIASDFISIGISGIEVTKITKIEDRTLYYNFSDAVKKAFEANTPQTRKLKDLFDYLFVVRSKVKDPLDFISDGCGWGKITVLSNTIGLTDNGRLREAELSEITSDELLLCKVYVAEMKEHKHSGTIPTSSDYATAGGVYVNVSSHKNTQHTSHQRLYYVFHSSLILPEYNISIKYIIESGVRGKNKHNEINGKNCSDEELIGMNPQPVNRPKLSMLDAETILQHSQEAHLEHIKDLDLACNRLSRFRFSSSLPHLVSLTLSYNELDTAEDFCNMPNLQTLDVSFNKIASLQGMKSLPKLTVLDISWNQLHDQYSDVTVIKKHMASLQSLDIRHNMWRDEINTVHIIGTLRSLCYLNGSAISEEETTSALRQVVSTHPPLSALLPHCRVDDIPPASLSLLPIAQQIIKHSSRRPVQLLNSNGSWTSQVTAIDLSSLKLQRLACLDQLVNLKWVCLQDNDLVSIESIEKCLQLEDLTLDSNFLVDPPNLDYYAHLQWLSISDNCLHCIPRMSADLILSTLTCLNISGNRITSLQGIECFPCLQEFYASRNPIDNLRQLFPLKPLSHLLIADFSHTPISSLPMYRIFTIFHVPSLKCLDAKTISNSEIALAKEKLGARLTQDSIYEKFPDQCFSLVKTLDFPNCGLKQVDLSPVKNFDNLFSLNLEHNSLTSFSGIIQLRRLKVLCLNHNRIEGLVKQVGGADGDSTPILPSLQVLHLAYNGISQLPPLQLHRLINLRALFLQGNEISRVEGLGGLYSLTELVLDRNKIKQLQEHSLSDLSQLKELHIEENRLCDLSNINFLKKLEHLFVGMNRIQEYSDLEKLAGLDNLLELSVISNPISRRMQHRSLLVYKLPSLQSLDGVTVSNEERQMAEITFSDRQEDTLDQQVLPTLNNTGQVKVMSIPFHVNSSGVKKHSSQTTTAEMRNIHMQTLQSFQGKRYGRRC